MIQSQRMLPKTSSQKTIERITSFQQRYGEAHLQLACHAAITLALTPDLLYRLWAEFQWDINGVALNIPWVAVTDLLFSCLCDEVGNELYEMDEAIRQELLRQFQQDSRFSSRRLREVSEFLLTYVRPQLENPDIDIRDFAQAQRWTALTYTNPRQAAQEIASALTTLSWKDLTEWERLTSVMEIFAEELSDYKPLLVYARGMRNFVQGDTKRAAKMLAPVLDENNQIRVAGVNLPIPDPIRSRFSRLTIASNFLRKYRQLMGVALIAIVLPSSLIYYLSTRSLIVRPPGSITDIGLALPATHPLYKTPPVTSINQLRDVGPNNWYYEALRSLAERYGIIYPYKDGTFHPDRAMTRAELIDWEGNAFRVLYRLLQADLKTVFSNYKNSECFLAQEPTLNTFVRPSDVRSNDWYYEAYQIVNWISDHDFMAPQGKFAGTRVLTRGDMSIFLNRFLNGLAMIIYTAVTGCREDIDKAKKIIQEKEVELDSIVLKLGQLNRSKGIMVINPKSLGSGSIELAQVTSVNQLRDTTPNSSSYEDLRSLVERYGCAVGYPDRTLRESRATTRAEMASLMNACLNMMERLIQDSVAIFREDREKIDRLIKELILKIDALNNRPEISQADKKKLDQILQEIRPLEKK